MKKYLYILITIGFLASCKKYEQGPSISFLSKKKRLVKVWRVENVFNPDNIVQVYDFEGTIEFKEDKTYREITPDYTLLGDWDFSPNKEHVNVYNPGLISFRILKLEKNNLWLIDEVANKEYHMVPW